MKWPSTPTGLASPYARLEWHVTWPPLWGPRNLIRQPDIYLYLVADLYSPRREWLSPRNTTISQASQNLPLCGSTGSATRPKFSAVAPTTAVRTSWKEGASIVKPLLAILSPRGARPSTQKPSGALILCGPRSLSVPLPKAHLAAASRLLYRPPLVDHAKPRLGFPLEQTLPSCGRQSD